MPLREPLPPYLHNIDPMELEDIPLQVALLTMELNQHRAVIAAMLERHDQTDAKKRDRMDAGVGIGDVWLEVKNG
jgi:hypothetical protein